MFWNYFVWILFFGTVKSPPSPPRTGASLPNCNQYQSISNPNRQIAISVAHPIGPLYVRIVIYFDMITTIPGAKPITLSVEHHYIRIEGPCRSNVIFSSKNLPIRDLNIRIIMYNDFSDDLPLAVFHYKFDNTYRSMKMELYDTRKNFAIQVGIRRRWKEHIPTTPDKREDVIARLKNLPPSDGNICVVTINGGGVSFRINYNEGLPTGIITKITTTHLLKDKVTLQSTHPAFECKTPDDIRTDNLFIVEFSEGEEVQNKVYWTQYNPEPVYKNQRYTLRDDYAFRVDVDDPSYLANKKKIYLLNTQPVSMTCSDNKERQLFKLRSGKNYWAEELKSVRAVSGVKRDSLVTKSLSDPCA